MKGKLWAIRKLWASASSLEKDAARAAHKITKQYIRFLWRRHKRHYQSAFTFFGKMRPAIYDDQCLFCQAFKPIEDEFVAEVTKTRRVE